MIKRTVHAVFASLALLAGSGAASAGVTATLTFTTPFGIVGPTDSIDIFVTLALDSGSSALVSDGSGIVTSGLTLADIQANLLSGLPSGVDPTVDNLTSQVNVFLACSGTFFIGCGGTPYDFNFAFDPFNLNWLPGTSIDFLFGILTPTGGVAPAGTYTLDNVGLIIQVFDADFSNVQIAEIPISSISDSGGSAFTRTVVDPVPEPATCAFVLAGLVAVVGAKRRLAR